MDDYEALLHDNLTKVAAALAREAPDCELLADGQEEVFSRTEVETGAIEHQTETHRPANDARGDR